MLLEVVDGGCVILCEENSFELDLVFRSGRREDWAGGGGCKLPQFGSLSFIHPHYVFRGKSRGGMISELSGDKRKDFRGKSRGGMISELSGDKRKDFQGYE